MATKRNTMKPAQNRLPDGWRECEWPCDAKRAAKMKRRGKKCYVRNIRRGKIYLRGDEKYFTYTVSCGKSSERSFTGGFFGHNYLTHIRHAMNEIDAMNSTGNFD